MKKWYQSKTIWVNVFAALLAIIPMINEEFLSMVGVTNTTKWLAIVGFCTTVFNIINRLLTNKGIDTAPNK